MLWRGAHYVAVDRDDSGYVIVGDYGCGHVPSWESVQKFCLGEGWRPTLAVYEHTPPEEPL